MAERVARSLSRYDDVFAISLLGSVARGNADEASDVDILVISEAGVRQSRLLRRLPPPLRQESLSLLSYSTDRWMEDVARGSLFLHHLRLEGRILYDSKGLLESGLEAIAARPPDVVGEIHMQLRRLRLYDDLDRLNGQHLFALAHLYAIGKATAIARCVGLGEPIFVKEDALKRLAAQQPHLRAAAAAVTRLRPFYDLGRGRSEVVLPFEPVGADKEIRCAIGAIERLGCA